VGARASMDDVEKRNSWPYRDSNSDPSIVQPVTSRYTDYAMTAQIVADRQKYAVITVTAKIY
jgi:hypothetical protein